MNVKSIISLEFVKNNREYSFNIPFGVPFEECFQVVDELIADLKSMQEQQKAKADADAQNQSQSQPIEPELV